MKTREEDLNDVCLTATLPELGLVVSVVPDFLVCLGQQKISQS